MSSRRRKRRGRELHNTGSKLTTIGSHLFRSFKEGEALEDQELKDRTTKLGMLIGIYRRLKTLYSGRVANAWGKLPNTNPLFEGKRPVEFMADGGIPAMAAVALLLDSRVGINSLFDSDVGQTQSQPDSQ